MMKLYKIAALIYADMMLLRNTKWRSADYVYFPLTTIIIWGLFSIFVSGYAVQAGIIVLAVQIIWNFAYLAQSQVNMQINEDSWSGSIKQIFVSGISPFEYLTARLISATIVSLLVACLLVAVSVTFFGLSIFIVQWQVFSVLMLATLVASVGLSIFVAAGMIALGREYGFLAWTVLQIFIVLSAPFYPVSIYPEALRPLVTVMPYTAIFEGTRAAIGGTITGDMLARSVIVSLIYLIVSLPIYKFTMKKALERGWLVRLG